MEQIIINTKESRELVNIIAVHVASGKSVKLTGFGVIFLKDTAPHKARNLKTGEPIDIPAGKKIKVKISSTFKKAII